MDSHSRHDQDWEWVNELRMSDFSKYFPFHSWIRWKGTYLCAVMQHVSHQMCGPKQSLQRYHPVTWWQCMHESDSGYDLCQKSSMSILWCWATYSCRNSFWVYLYLSFNCIGLWWIVPPFLSVQVCLGIWYDSNISSSPISHIVGDQDLFFTGDAVRGGRIGCSMSLTGTWTSHGPHLVCLVVTSRMSDCPWESRIFGIGKCWWVRMDE